MHGLTHNHLTLSFLLPGIKVTCIKACVCTYLIRKEYIYNDITLLDGRFLVWQVVWVCLTLYFSWTGLLGFVVQCVGVCKKSIKYKRPIEEKICTQTEDKTHTQNP